MPTNLEDQYQIRRFHHHPKKDSIVLWVGGGFKLDVVKEKEA